MRSTNPVRLWWHRLIATVFGWIRDKAGDVYDRHHLCEECGESIYYGKPCVGRGGA